MPIDSRIEGVMAALRRNKMKPFYVEKDRKSVV